MNLSGITYPGNGLNIFTEDFEHEQESLGAEITQRDLDLLGSGVHRGGSVVPAGVTAVELTELTVAYDPDGKRIEAPVQFLALPASSTGKLVLAHVMVQTEHFSADNQDPVPTAVVWRANSSQLAYRQGELGPLDVPLWGISVDAGGTVTVGEDLRVWRSVQGRNIGTAQLETRHYGQGTVTNLILHPDNKTGLIGDLRQRITAASPPSFAAAINVVDLNLEILEAMFAQNRKELGEYFMLDDFRPPSAIFPAFCLSAPGQALYQANWPDLFSHYRQKKLIYDPCGDSPITNFEVVSWAVASNMAILTFKDSVPEKAFLECLAEDQLVQGSFVNWRTVTLPAPIGNINAGTYAIAGVNALNRQLSFAYIASDNSGSVASKYVVCYPHRIADSEVAVRHFQMAGRGFITVGDSASEWIGGLRRRDRSEQHTHVSPNYYVTARAPGAEAFFTIYADIEAGTSGHSSARTGPTTDIRGISVFPYVWASRYIP